MNNDENLDLLDLGDENAGVDDTLPDAAPYVAGRPHRPWLLILIGLAIVVLAVFIIVRVVDSNSSSSREIDLDGPVAAVQEEPAPVVSDTLNVPDARPVPVQTAPVPQPAVQTASTVRPEPAPQPVAQPVSQPASAPRVIEDRQDVQFNPARGTVVPKPIVVPAPKVAKTPTKPKSAPKPVAQKVANGGWYVQLGSYSTREAAAAAEKKIRNGHQNLFNGKQFVILAAVLPNGSTTYRLRVAFANSNDANGFCRNAKSDGLDCYVAK